MVMKRNVYDMSVSSTCVTCGPTHPFGPTMWAAASAAKIESHTVKMMLVVVCGEEICSSEFNTSNGNDDDSDGDGDDDDDDYVDDVGGGEDDTDDGDDNGDDGADDDSDDADDGGGLRGIGS